MISRLLWQQAAVALTTSLTTTKPIDFREAAGGSIGVIGNLGTLTFHGAITRDGTYYPIHDSSNNAVVLTVAQAKGYAFPPECYAWAYIKIVVGTNGTADISVKG